jgi:GT2 family glycosyltransferase
LTSELSLVVITRNSRHRLGRFLPALASAVRSLRVETEVIVVDDASEPSSAPVGRVEIPGVRWLHHRRHLGAGAGRNTGAAVARGDWLLFCDDDVELSADDLCRLWRVRDPEHCVVPEVRGPSGELQNSVVLEWRLFDPKFVFHQAPMPVVAFPVGTCFLIRRSLYWAVGGFDERIVPNYFEDTAFGMALRRRAATVRMVEGAVARHQQHGWGDKEHLARIRPLLFENRWVFCAVALRGRERVVALALGAPRVVLESARRHSFGPLLGYTRALTRLPAFRSREPAVRPLTEKLLPAPRADAARS